MGKIGEATLVLAGLAMIGLFVYFLAIPTFFSVLAEISNSAITPIERGHLVTAKKDSFKSLPLKTAVELDGGKLSVSKVVTATGYFHGGNLLTAPKMVAPRDGFEFVFLGITTNEDNAAQKRVEFISSLELNCDGKKSSGFIPTENRPFSTRDLVSRSFGDPKFPSEDGWVSGYVAYQKGVGIIISECTVEYTDERGLVAQWNIPDSVTN